MGIGIVNIRCPECLTWQNELQPHDPVYECPKCDEQYTRTEGELWIEADASWLCSVKKQKPATGPQELK